MDLKIRHRSGWANANADALSRNPNEAKVAQVQSDSDSVAVDQNLAKHSQYQDPNLLPMLTYLDKESLPDDEKQAKQLLLKQSQFNLMDGVLHYEDPKSPGYWHLVVPKELKSAIWTKHMEDDLVDTFLRSKCMTGWHEIIGGVECEEMYDGIAKPVLSVRPVKVTVVLVDPLFSLYQLVVPSTQLEWMCCSYLSATMETNM